MDTPLPEWKEARERLQCAIADFEFEAAQGEELGERTDLWDQVAEVPIADLRLLLSQSAKIERLEAALRPFARCWEGHIQHMRVTPEKLGAMIAGGSGMITAEHFREAVQALADPNV